MRHFVIGFILLIAVINCQSQNAFYDAQTIASITAEQEQKLEEVMGHDSNNIKKQMSLEEQNTIKDLLAFLNAADPFCVDIHRELLNSTIIKKILLKIKAQPINQRNPMMGFGEIAAIAETTTSGLGNAFSRISSADFQSMLIDATATYLAESFKEDVVYIYFSKFQEKLQKIPEFQGLFPKTYEKVIKMDPFNFNELGNGWKTAFESDLQNLPFQFRDFLQYSAANKWYSKFKSTDYFKYYSYLIDILQPLIKGYHPVEVLQLLDRKYWDENSVSSLETYKSLLHFINLLQSNLQDTSKHITSDDQFSNVWIGFNQLKDLNTDAERRYFFALIYLQDKSFFQNNTAVGQKLSSALFKDNNQDIYRKFLTAVPDFLILLNQIENSVSELKEAKKLGQDKKDLIKDYMENVLAILKTANNILKDLKIGNDLTSSIDTYLSYTDLGYEMYTKITSKDYPGLIDNVIQLIDSLQIQSITQNIVANIATIHTDWNNLLSKRGIANIKESDLVRAILNHSNETGIDVRTINEELKTSIKFEDIKSNDSNFALIKSYIEKTNSDLAALNQLIVGDGSLIKLLALVATVEKYGKVVAQVASAQNSSDLKAVIKTYVLPSGSFAIQRVSFHTLTIGAKVGLFGSAETNPRNFWNQFKPTFGLTVPLGIEYSWAIHSGKKTKYQYVTKTGEIKYLTGSNQSLFLQLFDITAAFNYRLTKDSGSLPEQITFRQIFSPGLSYNFAIKEVPFDIGVGVQYTPSLRTIGSMPEANSLRIFLRFSWSKPLIPLIVDRETKTDWPIQLSGQSL